MADNIKMEVRHISKSFPGVKALDDVNFKLKKGTVHVLCGENGAGKSTLMKILYGIYHQDEGEIIVDGKVVKIANPIDARNQGISMIFQELSFVSDMTLEENLFLGRWIKKNACLIDWEKIRDETKKLLEKEGLPYKPDTPLRSMSVSNIQMIEILKAVSFNAEILIMDEPTSSISNKDVESLISKIEELRSRGMSIIYISHKMDEIFRIADEITILRDGKTITTLQKDETNIDQVIELMVGRKLENQYPKEIMEIGEEIFKVEHLTKQGVFEDINFNVKRGEIVGFAGLVGAGRTETMNTLFGLDTYDSGDVYLNRKPIQVRNVREAIANGIAMVTEDRRRYGIIPVRSVMENASLATLKKYFAGGRRHKHEEIKDISEVFEKVRVKTPSLETPIKSLSGGNQQKVILAKWLLCNSEVMIMDEPTRGIDVGAKKEIYELIGDFAKNGKGIIMISSELPELMGMCDRIYVMKEGKITGCLENREIFSQEQIMNYAVS
ncbi:sugar ABC transporter ATP-binding protein [Anaerobium acetethylicum]|uniref:Inositol transport system ATP-binding protein n=1 Tax=Anaerobium acetethylicum TaxID=1619234 RepID=A0A1D3TXZ9_9FIRM|nr:sugar ABC transporter ATP-binding protein [Anaerobium acetethylicum]SCP99267.1 inositol transport system ATP-binding protein [Anaerobium acetethylicum]